MLNIHRHLISSGKVGNYAPAHSFRFLLFCLILMMILPAHFPTQDRGLFWMLMLTVCLLASLYLVANRLIELLIGIALALSVATPGYLSVFFPNTGTLALSTIATILFFSYISLFLIRYLYMAEHISEDLISASICLYIIAGMIWGYVYYLTETLSPGSFSFPQTNQDHYSEIYDMLYFSFITLSTLGYGDILPVSRAARSWTSVEALFGQIYLTVVVAYLVGLYINTKNERRQIEKRRKEQKHHHQP